MDTTYYPEDFVGPKQIVANTNTLSPADASKIITNANSYFQSRKTLISEDLDNQFESGNNYSTGQQQTQKSYNTSQTPTFQQTESTSSIYRAPVKNISWKTIKFSDDTTILSKNDGVSGNTKYLSRETYDAMRNIGLTLIYDTKESKYRIGVANDVKMNHITFDKNINEGIGYYHDANARGAGMWLPHVNDSQNYNYEYNKKVRQWGDDSKSVSNYHQPDWNDDRILPIGGKTISQIRYEMGLDPLLKTEKMAKAFEYYFYNYTKKAILDTALRNAKYHIFITKPDLYLYERISTTNDTSILKIHSNIMNNPYLSEMKNILLSHPQVGRSLIDMGRSKDSTNINLYLSNQAIGFVNQGNTIDTRASLKNYDGINVFYSKKMNRDGGDLNIQFRETAGFETMKILQLWILYMHHTYVGNHWPCIDVDSGGGFTKFNNPILFDILDYAASIYIFWTDTTSGRILSHRKYFGVFPISDGSSILAKNVDSDILDTRILTDVTFKHQGFRDNDLRDLIAFNKLSNVTADINNAFNADTKTMATGIKRFVGPPFVDIRFYQNTNPNSKIDQNTLATYDNDIKVIEMMPKIDMYLSFTTGDTRGHYKSTGETLSQWIARYY